MQGRFVWGARYRLKFFGIQPVTLSVWVRFAGIALACGRALVVHAVYDSMTVAIMSIIRFEIGKRYINFGLSFDL
jgi:hypothetical protein